MTSKQKYVIAGIIVTVLTVAVFSPHLIANSFAFSAESMSNPDMILLQKLVSSKDTIGSLIVQQSNLDENSRRQTDLPIILTYIDGQTSELVVGIDDKAPPAKVSYEVKIRKLIGDDIPIRIEFGQIEPLACNSRTSPCNPVVGGVQVNPQITSDSGPTTLSLQTSDNQARSGFIMVGHGVKTTAACGTTNKVITQGPSTNIAGTVVTNPSAPRLSDSAFVQLASGQIYNPNKIYQSPNVFYTVTSKVASSQVPQGSSVLLSGINGQQSGGIVSVGAVITQNNNNCGTLNFVATNLIPKGGDSGSPIFSPPNGSNQVQFYGIAVSAWTGNPTGVLLYSPWERIQTDLGVN
jgi:hypothetical protein